MQTPFSDPTAEAEILFGYANAERMETRWRVRSKKCAQNQKSAIKTISNPEFS
jgi:hypothetical protein